MSKRFGGINEIAYGENVDLLDCYKMLMETVFAEYDTRQAFRRNSVEDRIMRRRSSTPMRLIVTNLALHTEDVFKDVFDRVLYSQTRHMNLGFGPTREDDAERYEEMLDRYPGRVQAETELRRLGVNL